MPLGAALFAVFIQLSIFVGIIIFAVKLVGRLKDIAESQKSIAKSQARLVQLLVNSQQDKNNS